MSNGGVPGSPYPGGLYDPPGYICSKCGIRVGYNQSHACSQAGNGPWTVPLTPDPVKVRIASALERIAVALEKEVTDGRRDS